MKKVLIGLLMITLYAVAQPGQSKYQGRSGYQQSIIWNDLHKSLQDSIRNIVGDSASANITDSLNTFSGINGIQFNSSGRDFGQKIVKDTTTAKAYKPDSAGTMIYMKQLSSANSAGGGLLVYKSSGSALKGIRFAATGGGIWERAELAYSPDVNVEWCGAIGGDANDDYAAVAAAYTAALSTGGDVLFGDGIYRLSAAIEITPEGSNSPTSVRRPYFIGKGRNRTELVFYNDTDGFWFNGGISEGGWVGDWGLRDLHIQGNNKAAGSEGVILDSLGQGGIDGCYIEGFETGVRIYQCNQTFISNSTIRNNVFGIYSTISPNEFYIENLYIVESDSIGIYQTSGNGTYMVGGQIQNGDIGVYIESGTITMDNVNSEGVLVTFAYLGTNGTLVARKVNVLAGRDSTRFATIANGALFAWNCGMASNHADTTDVIMTGTGAQFECDNSSALTAHWTPTSTKYNYRGTTNMRGFSATSLTGLATVARWGKFFKLHHRAGVMSDFPFYVAKMYDGNYFTAPIINDQRVTGAVTSQPAIDSWPGRNVHGFETFTMSELDADSIMNFTAIVDTSGWNTLYSASCIIEYNNIADTTKNFSTKYWIADVNAAAGTGTITFCVDFTDCPTLPPTGQTFVFRWHAYIRPLGWTQ